MLNAVNVGNSGLTKLPSIFSQGSPSSKIAKKVLSSEAPNQSSPSKEYASELPKDLTATSQKVTKVQKITRNDSLQSIDSFDDLPANQTKLPSISRGKVLRGEPVLRGSAALKTSRSKFERLSSDSQSSDLIGGLSGTVGATAQIVGSAVSALSLGSGGGDVVASGIGLYEQIRDKKPVEAGKILSQATECAGAFSSAVVQSMTMSNAAVLGGAILTTVTGPVTAVGALGMTIYQAKESHGNSVFHDEFVDAIKSDEGIIPFLEANLTLSEEEMRLPEKQRDKILAKKHAEFEKNTSPEILAQAIQAINRIETLQDDYLKGVSYFNELIKELAVEIEHQSYENRIRNCVNASLAGLNVGGALLAIPTHGISLVLSGGATLLFVIANKDDRVVKKITSHFWKKTEMGRSGQVIIKQMTIHRHSNGTHTLGKAKELIG